MIATPTDATAHVASLPAAEPPEAVAPPRPGGEVDALAHGFVRVEARQSQERILLFDSWARLSALLTPQRRRMLRHLRGRPEPSLSALANALERPYGLVHEDLSVLEMAGLVERSSGEIRVSADKLSVVIDL